ncbi:MAG: type II toxin-antitoxin system VapC family toxin [Deltaproteobacteria bacterium]|nr:type II toxin-antitoxin system VapC family toxin [Deltaproteobacteria bacterium]MDQ3300331.1 type II toxin-antitoxin system VapC family toxin [Myxococcota bacterium]
MIVLDTNVISELMRGTPSPAVVLWVNSKAATSLYTTSVTQAEILHGILLLPKGKRRDAIATAADEMFERDFASRILGFGSDAAAAYATIAATRRRAGRPIAAFDAQIAAIARSNDADLATRNIADFEDCGIDLIDPWNARR